jgi:hypothetical protein
VTGFIVESEAEAMSAIGKLAILDRARVGAGFERRFTARRMAQDYITYCLAEATILEVKIARSRRPETTATLIGPPEWSSLEC